MLALFDKHLPVHHGHFDALGELFAASRSARQVIRFARFQRRDALGIENHQVRRHALAHETPIIQTEKRCRNERELADRVLQRHDLLLPHPVREQIRGVAIVGAENDVRTTVRLSDDRIWARQQRFHRRFIAVHFAPFEFGLQVFFQNEIEQRVEHVLVLFPRNLGNALSRELLVLRQRRFEHELQIPTARKVAGKIGIHRRLDGLFVQFGARLRIAESLFADVQG